MEPDVPRRSRAALLHEDALGADTLGASFSAGSGSTTVSFVKKLALAAAGIAAFAAPLVVGMMNARAVPAQSPAAAKPKFEVAAIRPCGGGRARPGAAKGNGGGSGRRNSVSPGRLNLSCVTVADLIRRAYLTTWSTRLMPKLS